MIIMKLLKIEDDLIWSKRNQNFNITNTKKLNIILNTQSKKNNIYRL